MSQPNFIDAVLLFGDSLTQTCAAGSLFQRMAEYYERRLDVVNRGFGGFNTEWSRPILHRAFATSQVRSAGQAQNVRLMTLWFGANDSVTPDGAQHVPLDRYKSNLVHMISTIKDKSSSSYSPDTRIIMITPPPIIESRTTGRKSAITKQYADACIEVAHDSGVPVIDLYSAIISDAGGKSEAQLESYLYDGLHFTPKAYEVLFGAIKSTITSKYPELAAENMVERIPAWSDMGFQPDFSDAAGKIERHLEGQRS